MKNDTDLPQSVTILEHVQKPTKQRFFVLGCVWLCRGVIGFELAGFGVDLTQFRAFLGEVAIFGCH